MKIFFSIVIPTFNQSSFLDKCIKSVLKQTYKNYEIIIIDNNSTDETRKIIKKYLSLIKFKRIRNNGIIAKSRNLGIRMSKGNWISFLDSDDEWTRDKLKEQYKKIKYNNIDVICNDEWIIKKNKKKIWSYGPDKKNLYLHMLSHGNQLSTSATSVNKDFIKKNKIFFNESRKMITAEDYDFFLNIAKAKGKFFFLNKPLGYHNFHEQSSSNKFRLHKNSINQVLKFHCNNNLKFYQKCKLHYVLKDKLVDLIHENKKIRSFKHIYKIFFKNPLETISILYFLFLKFLKNKKQLFVFKVLGL